MQHTLIVVVSVFFGLTLCQPDEINITTTIPIIPEGIEWHPTLNKFIASSIAQGTIFLIEDNGTAIPFVTGSSLLSTGGLQVDTNLNVLLGVNINFTSVSRAIGGDFGGPFFSSLAVANLTNGELITTITLQNENVSFSNDVASDDLGNAYVTDSFGGKIWKVDSTGTVTVHASDARWTPGQFGLNGIEFGNGFLLTATNSGLLFKVSTDTNATVTQVNILNGNVSDADGIILNNNGELLVCRNFLGQVSLLRSSDNWTTASIEASAPVSSPNLTPTTLALRNNIPYVIFAYFGATNPPSTYVIKRVIFPAATSTSAQESSQSSTPTSATQTSSPSSSTNQSDSSEGSAFLPTIVVLLALLAILI